VSAGFIAEKVEIDAFASRSKGKQAKKGKASAARSWGFVAQMKRTDVYRQYFDPTPAVEWQIMQLQPEVRALVKHCARSDAVAGHGHSG
jgi:16S rRNA A1518/A1519 N6-dimethyltransferase RsmA/KsgA/DIM1 with predicted DNA glycosylase/AP lyase activity